MRSCSSCPKHATLVPEERKEERVKVVQWGTRHCPLKGKKLHALWEDEKSLVEVAAEYDRQLAILPRHIFTAARQWQAYKELCENLAPGQLLTIEDYQMNLEVSSTMIPC